MSLPLACIEMNLTFYEVVKLEKKNNQIHKVL